MLSPQNSGLSKAPLKRIGGARGARGGRGQKGSRESAPDLKAGPLAAQLWRGREGREGQVFQKLFRLRK